MEANYGTFKCEYCGGVFTKNRSDEEALAEAATIFSPSEIAMEQAIICDDCYNKFMAWFKLHPEIRKV